MKAQYLSVVVMAALMAATSAQASVDISSGRTKHMNCTGGVCAPTEKAAVLNATDLANMLATSDVKIVTGSGAVTIMVSAPFSWTSTHRLTLDANLNVSFHAPVEVAGQGAVTITTNDGGAGGDLLFLPGASLEFWDTSSNLIINGKAFVLINSVASFALKANSQPNNNFALIKSYDAAIDKAYNDCPVTAVFLGSFEGLGHSISNLAIKERGHRIEYAALFCQIGTGGVVRDVGVINSNVSSARYGDGGGAALLAAWNAGTIFHVSVSGSVQANYKNQGSAGGVVAGNAGTISDSQSSATVSAGQYGSGGGIAGWNGGTVDESSASGTVWGGNSGGLVGYNNGVITNSHASGATTCGGLVCDNVGASIVNCFATGAVTGSIVGGLVGQSNSLISGSYATGNVTGNDTSYAGGLVGFVTGGTIQNSYSTGSVNGGRDYEQNNGGLIGYQYSRSPGTEIQSVYATGLVTGPGSNGGVIGVNIDSPSGYLDTYWNVTTSQMDNGCGGGVCTGIAGLTDAELKSGLPSGFDHAIWAESATINNGYPYLIANPPPQ